MSEEVIKILDYLGEKIGVTIDWTSNNIIPYVNQLCEKFIKWEINTSYAWMAIMGAVTIIALIAAIVIHCSGGWDGFEWIIFGIILVVTLIVCGYQILDIVTCNTFPEKIFYDRIKELLNNSNI